MEKVPEPWQPISAVTETWRSQALNAVLWASLIVALPAVSLAAINWPIYFSPPMRVLTFVLYSCLVVIAASRRAKPQCRAWVFLLVLYVIAAIQLYRAGMAGDGRITLVAIPLYALLLAGPRSGWAALVLDVVLYAAFIGRVGWGRLGHDMEVQHNPTEPGFWVVQGIMALAAVVPLLLLLSRFRTLHVRAVEAEQRTAAQVREESAMRTAAFEALDRATRKQRRLEEEITRASEDERRRLGSELHDGLCQQLTAALLQCVAAENQAAVESNPMADSLRGLRELLEDSIGVAYEVARGLCPLDIGADSLGPALERLANRTREIAGLDCEFQERGDTAIGDRETALHLYRIAQEAVANAVKHADPHRILIRLCGLHDTLRLQVEDDGRGLPETLDASRGMGMNIMTYRARMLGGELDVEAVAGGGTRIVCRLLRGASGDGIPTVGDDSRQARWSSAE